MAGLAAFASAGPAEADRCVALAAELRQLGEEDASLRTSVFTLRESLASEGHDPERIQELSGRFGGLHESEQRLLRSQSERALAYQTEVAVLERTRTESMEELSEIDALRHRWRTPAWLLTTLGLASTLAGAIMPRVGGLPVISMSLLGAGIALAAIGSYNFV